MSRAFPFLKNWFSKNRSNPTEQDTADNLTLPSDRLKDELYPSEIKPKKETRANSVQDGFFESIDLMRSMCGHLEKQADAQKNLLEAVPLTLNTIQTSIENQTTQNQQLTQTLNTLGSTLATMNQNQQQNQNYLQSMVLNNEKKLNILMVLIAIATAVSVFAPLYFHFNSNSTQGTSSIPETVVEQPFNP